jgi:hypothetical protein
MHGMGLVAVMVADESNKNFYACHRLNIVMFAATNLENAVNVEWI